MPKVLMVYDQYEEAGPLLESELTAAFREKGLAAHITASLNGENARQHLPEDFSLVITFLHIRKHPLDKVSQDEEEGFELVRWMNLNHMNKPSILISPSQTRRLKNAESVELNNCDVVQSGTEMVKKVVDSAVRIVEKAKAPVRCLEIDIKLSARTRWHYRLKGKGFNFEKEGELS